MNASMIPQPGRVGVNIIEMDHENDETPYVAVYIRDLSDNGARGDFSIHIHDPADADRIAAGFHRAAAALREELARRSLVPIDG